MNGAARPGRSAPTVARYPWTTVYLCAMATLTLLAVIFDWTVTL